MLPPSTTGAKMGSLLRRTNSATQGIMQRGVKRVRRTGQAVTDGKALQRRWNDVMLPTHPFFSLWGKLIAACVAYVALWIPMQAAFEDDLAEPEILWRIGSTPHVTKLSSPANASYPSRPPEPTPP
eukprot:5383570-Prymnesium_polylepis.2